MYKSQFVQAIAARAGISHQQAEAAVAAMQIVVSAALEAGEPIRLIGFGSWKVAQRAERRGRHPRTGEPMLIPARRVPVFRAGKRLKGVLDQPVKQA